MKNHVKLKLTFFGPVASGSSPLEPLRPRQVDEMKLGRQSLKVSRVGGLGDGGWSVDVVGIGLEVKGVDVRLGRPLLLDVEGEDSVAPRALVVHVGRRRRPVEGSVLQARDRLVVRMDRP